MKSLIKTLLKEELLKKDSNTMHFWHGGNLNDIKDVVAHKKGRHEYGAGLYLITSHNVVEKYIKGGRKLYYVVVEKGNDLSDVDLDLDNVNEFVKNYVIKNKINDVNSRLAKYIKDNKISASIFNNIMLSGVISSTNTDKLRDFLINNDIDYELIDNAFGWHEQMMVLYDMKNKISHIEIEGGYKGLAKFLKELLGKESLEPKDYDLNN
jgi:hypothetical protein